MSLCCLLQHSFSFYLPLQGNSFCSSFVVAKFWNEYWNLRFLMVSFFHYYFRVFGFSGFALLLPTEPTKMTQKFCLKKQESIIKWWQFVAATISFVYKYYQLLVLLGHQFCAHFKFARGSSINPQQFDEKLRTKYVKSARLPCNYLRKGTWFCLDADTITQMGLLARALFGIW